MNELTKQQITKYKIALTRLFRGSKQSMYINEVIVIPIMTQTRLPKPKKIKFRSGLGFNQINLILKKEQSVVIPLLKEFYSTKC